MKQRQSERRIAENEVRAHARGKTASRESPQDQPASAVTGMSASASQPLRKPVIEL